MSETIAHIPQPGPQEEFLSCSADIAIYGGAAGGGKSYALLLDLLNYVGVAGFNAVVFRRNATQVRNPGGLWEESGKLYPLFGGRAASVPLEWTFPSGAKVKFAHLEYEGTVNEWQGAQVCALCFDELTHFSRQQFFYMLSRNRSMCGVPPYVRATCNPDSDSWVAEFISWWIDQETGLPIPERSGRERWFVRANDKITWADKKADLLAEFGDDCAPKTATFIASTVYDNKKLLAANPGYLANLKALPLVDRERLLHGNWKIRPAAGLLFRRQWVTVADEAPAGLKSVVRYWDLAATEKTDANDPDFTACVKMARGEDGRFWVLHGASMRQSPLHVREAIRNLAAQDGKAVAIGLPQDPGQAGKSQAQDYARMLAGYRVTTRQETGDKATRFGPFSAQCEAGNVTFLRGPWNEEFFSALEGFPDAKHDDHADACSGAFNLLMDARAPMRVSPAALLRPGRRLGAFL